MYVPEQFRVDDLDTLCQFMRANAFATLVSRVEGELVASHLPFLIECRGERLVLLAHVARANPQWKELDRQQCLVVFLGQHAYISPSWYEDRESVPTWNYMAVHAYGPARLMENPEAVAEYLRKLVVHNEVSLPRPWSIDEIPPESLQAQMRAIVAFEIEVARVDGKFKLSQNRSRADREGAISGLERSGASAALIAAMRAAD